MTNRKNRAPARNILQTKVAKGTPNKCPETALEECFKQVSQAVDKATQREGKGMSSSSELARLLLPVLRKQALWTLCRAKMAPGLARPMAEDIAHDVFMELMADDARVLKRWSTSAARTNPYAFFRTIAKRRAIDAWKKGKCAQTVLVDESHAVWMTTVEPRYERDLSVRACLERAIVNSSDAGATRRLAHAVWITGENQTELAEGLGISAAAIHKRTSRLREKFAELWNEETAEAA